MPYENLSPYASSSPTIGSPIELSWFKDSDGTAAADLSVSQHTQWVAWQKGATSAAVYLGNTATGTPVGTRAIHVSGHGDSTVTTYSVYDGASPGAVSGAAMDDIIILSTPVRYIRLVYAATSGGTGAVHTDDSRRAGYPAYILFSGG